MRPLYPQYGSFDLSTARSKVEVEMGTNVFRITRVDSPVTIYWDRADEQGEYINAPCEVRAPDGLAFGTIYLSNDAASGTLDIAAGGQVCIEPFSTGGGATSTGVRRALAYVLPRQAAGGGQWRDIISGLNDSSLMSAATSGTGAAAGNNYDTTERLWSMRTYCPSGADTIANIVGVDAGFPSIAALLSLLNQPQTVTHNYGKDFQFELSSSCFFELDDISGANPVDLYSGFGFGKLSTSAFSAYNEPFIGFVASPDSTALFLKAIDQNGTEHLSQELTGYPFANVQYLKLILGVENGSPKLVAEIDGTEAYEASVPFAALFACSDSLQGVCLSSRAKNANDSTTGHMAVGSGILLEYVEA